MAVISRCLAVICLSLVAGMAVADEVREFGHPVMEQRYRELTASLRCPKCENQAIDDSNSPVSADMRDRVYALLQEGRSDREIQDFMVDRFGDYVLYNPRLEGRTYLLWGLPAVLVVVGAIVVLLIVRARRRASAQALSADERARLNELIDRERTE
ncbi:cytochrome c-type biogenesis protein [Aidingimonas halophila]|uniref:Cytochrome c-type biogenesis protein n=1 Tax=Aidingimonas halophila TaxID=574349 RepID=A0A1H2V880_9GAMM|nr:cytochrome c-type biogenesis protein [Aidingimonas halophila]GHC23933.1 cytochrome c [Aidingimonas halophila]SDW64490.1 cytochrome c-type biogenesis protein CcmH [Aidingimonas halophila]